MRLRRSRDGDGWILGDNPAHSGLWFESKEAAERWAEGMGVTITEGHDAQAFEDAEAADYRAFKPEGE